MLIVISKVFKIHSANLRSSKETDRIYAYLTYLTSKSHLRTTVEFMMAVFFIRLSSIEVKQPPLSSGQKYCDELSIYTVANSAYTASPPLSTDRQDSWNFS